MRQLILETEKIQKNGLIFITEKKFRYLKQVLRVKIGDMINVRLSDQNLYNSTVVQIDEKIKKITLQICQINSTKKSITRGVQANQIGLPKTQYFLFQFLPRLPKFEIIVRQATECGISMIIPIFGEYSENLSVNSLQGNKSERLNRIINEARQQSGSAIKTQLLEPMNLIQAIDFWNEQNNQNNQNEQKTGIVLSERNDYSESLSKVLQNKNEIQKIAICVGSEGGISPNEIQQLREKANFHAVHFDVNILRCETAALYGIAAIQSFFN